MKIIDLSKSIYDLKAQYPEFTAIMQQMGFNDITNLNNFENQGRFMTVEKGAAHHNISMDTIIEKFKDLGYHVVGIKH